MAQGIKLPTTIKNGRLELVSGDKYIRQLVETALGDGESENPFQDIALGEFMIFEINDPLVEGRIRERVESAFKSLERDKLAKLVTMNFEREGAEATMYLTYEDLETGAREELEFPLSNLAE
jgi:predicted nucleic acid-binding OB-fold protein